MAQLVLGIAGAVVGGYFGGPSGAQLGWAIGSAIGSSMTPPQKVQGPQQAIMDLRVTGAEYGQNIPWAQGSVGMAGQMWWNTDRRATTTVTTTESGGGKGGGGGTVTETSVTTYDMDMLLGLTDNEIAGITRIWKDGDLVWTNDSGATAGSLSASENANLWDRLTVYTGSITQLPDPTYEAAVGSDIAIAYRGRSYVFIQGLKLGQGGRVPNFFFEVVVSGTVVPAAWIERTPSEVSGWIDVAYGLGMFAAVAYTGTNRIMTSSDGVTWTDVTEAPTEEWLAVTFGQGRFIAVGENGLIARTEDGVNWFQADIVSAGSWLLTGVAYGEWTTPGVLGISQVFVAIDYDGPTLLRSTDGGENWTAVTCPVGAWYNIVYGNGLFVVVGSAPEMGGSINCVMTSPDGLTWTVRAASAALNWRGLAFGNGVFVATAINSSTVMTSPDGITWTSRTGAGNQQWFAVTFNEDTDEFVAVASSGAGNRVQRSADNGVTWTSEAASSQQNWRGVTYGGGLYTAVAAESNVMTNDGIDSLTKDPPTVQQVVERLCLRAGLTAGQVDASALASITRKVKSLAVSQVVPTRQPLELLMATYFFEMTLSDKIKFVPRGGAAVATIPYLHLGAANDGDEQPDPLSLREMDELEIPAQIALSFINIDNDYQQGTEHSDRLISGMAGSVSSVSMAIGMTPSEAKSVADVMLLDQAASRLSTPISLLGDYARLEPTDPVLVTDADGSTFRLRLVKKSDAFPLLSYQAVLDDASVLSSQGITSTDYTSGTVVAPATGTLMRLMDIPILSDAQNDPGFYVATKGDREPYPGSAVYYSIDDVVYERKATVDEAAVFGVCTTALGTWTGSRVMDEANSVTVFVGEGVTLSSSTRDAVLGSQTINAMLIGDEVIQFVTATLVSDGKYTLSRLLRGNRGTEWAMNGHAAGERCVLLRPEGIRRVSNENTDLGAARLYKGVTLGRAVSSADPEPFTNNGVGLKPFSPVTVRAARDGSGNIVFTVQRRTRFGVRMIGPLGISVPLGEGTEDYEIDVYESGAYATVVRTISVANGNTASYSEAEQTADGLTPGAIVYTRTYQLSAVVGRGYLLEQAA